MMLSNEKARYTCVCGRRLKFGASALGKRFSCPDCSVVLLVEELDGQLAVVKDHLLSADRHMDPIQLVFEPIVFLAGSVAGSMIGLFASQYFPLWETRQGNFPNFPWQSPRLFEIPSHCVVFGLLGIPLACGAAVAVASLAVRGYLDFLERRWQAMKKGLRKTSAAKRRPSSK